MLTIEDVVVPHFLFPSKESESTDKDRPLSYLTDELTLKEIISKLCKDLHHPIAVIDYNAMIEKGTQDKMESMVEMYPMRRSCSILRKCAGDKYCNQCDHFHAKCMDIDKDKIEVKIKDSLLNVPSFFYPEYKDRLPKVLEGFNRPVIEYHCPMLGYRELLFPLLYQRKLYGVFFAGQIMVHEKEDEAVNQKIRDSFFEKNRHEELFKSFIDLFNEQHKEGGELDQETIQRLVAESDIKAQPYDGILGFKQSNAGEEGYFSKNYTSYDEYLSFIKTICDTIAKTEISISEKYEQRRKKFFAKELGKIADIFFEKYKQKHDNTREKIRKELEGAWDALEVFASEIQRTFEFVENIIMFGDGPEIRIEASSKKEIVFSVPSGDKKQNGVLDFSDYSIDGINDYIHSLDNRDILGGLPDYWKRDNSILIRCHDIAMLIIVRELDKYKGLYISLAEAIGIELVRINSIIALCSANLMKEKYLLTLRLYRHENAHISTRLMGNINRYFSNDGQRFSNANREKRTLVCSDMKNTVQLISNIADNIAFVTGTGIANSDPQKDTMQLDVVEMLYKWQFMFNDELETRNLEIVVVRCGYDLSSVGYHQKERFPNRKLTEIVSQYGSYAAAPREITINARLFELLVYNLVDNAVKYAYRGTNIYLIWSRIDNEYELSVVSYGPQMPAGEDMYGLYVRGNDERFRQGDGLGLYVVKRIQEKLDLSRSHDSEMISEYNIPLIPWYNKTDFFRYKDYTKISESKLAINNNTPQALLAINEYSETKIKEKDVTPDYLKTKITNKTWKTSFYIRIPIRNGKKN